jgi:hypothetical protein
VVRQAKFGIKNNQCPFSGCRFKSKFNGVIRSAISLKSIISQFCTHVLNPRYCTYSVLNFMPIKMRDLQGSNLSGLARSPSSPASCQEFISPALHSSGLARQVAHCMFVVQFSRVHPRLDSPPHSPVFTVAPNPKNIQFSRILSSHSQFLSYVCSMSSPVTTREEINKVPKHCTDNACMEFPTNL